MKVARTTDHVCVICKEKIKVGERISWRRRGGTGVYHVACQQKELSTPVVSAPVVPIVLDKTPVPSVPASLPALSTLRESDTWFKILPAVLAYTDRVLLIGPPGTGKSTTAMKLADCRYRITMTETTSREELIGMFHLIEGETRWVDGPVTSAMRQGETVLIDEIDRYSPEAASLLYGLIDDKPHLTLPNGEQLTARSGYKVIMTSNEGLETLPVAVQDRIEIVLNAKTPHDDAINHLPYDVKTLTRRYYNGLTVKPIRLTPTVRRSRVFFHLTSNHLNTNIAAELVFGPEGAKEILSTLGNI